MRKFIRSFTILLLISTIIITSACRSSKTDSKKEDVLKGKIVILTEKRYEGQLKIAAENFKKLHQDVTIDIDIQDKLVSNISKEYINDKEKTVDIINLEDKYIQNVLHRLPDTFLDITNEVSYLKEKVPKIKLENLNLKGKTYGIPWSSSPKLIIYRSDILEGLGINVEDIKTWKNYIDLGKKIEETTGKNLITDIKSEDGSLHLILANQLNTSYFDNNGRLNLNSNEWIKALEMFKLLYSEGTVYDLSYRDSFIDFAKRDKIVSFIADPYQAADLIKYLPEQKGKWKAMKLPAFEEGGNRDVSIGGANLMINKASKNLEAAKEFIKFVATDGYTQIEMMNEYGTFPVYKSTYELVDFNENVDYYDSKTWFLFSSVEKGSQGMKYTSNFPILDEEIKRALSIDALKDKDIKVTIDILQKELENKSMKK